MRFASLLAVTFLSTACGGGDGSPDPEDPADFRDGFEAGLQSWSTDADVPPDPNRPGEDVEWSITASQEQAAEGIPSARYFLDGTQDDGTIWLVRPFDVLPNADHDVRLRFQFWSESESFNDIAMVAAYAGATSPLVEADFDTSRRANDATGWLEYVYDFAVRSDGTGRVWVAFGISAVFETVMTYFIDDVEIWIDPV
jgi:hypothetical protein